MDSHNGTATGQLPPQPPSDPFMNINRLFEHIYHFSDEAHVALKVLIARLPEPTQSEVAQELLEEAVTFCHSSDFLRKLKPFNEEKAILKARKYGTLCVFQGNSSSPIKLAPAMSKAPIVDPFQFNIWHLYSHQCYYLLKMLLARLSSAMRGTLASHLLLKLVKTIRWEQLRPFNVRLCKMKAFFCSKEGAPMDSPAAVSPYLADPFGDKNTFWQVMTKDNAFPLLKQLLARCPSDLRGIICRKLLKSSVRFLAEHNKLQEIAPYDTSKSNHLFYFGSSSHLSGQVHSKQHHQPNEQETFVKSKPSSTHDALLTSVRVPIVTTSSTSTSPLPCDTGDQAYKSPTLTNNSQANSTITLNSTEEEEWFGVPYDHSPLNDNSSFLELADFDWARTPSELKYPHSDSPLQIRESSIPSDFDWGATPYTSSDESDFQGRISYQPHNSYSSYDWAKTPSDANTSYNPRKPIVIRVLGKSKTEKIGMEGQSDASVTSFGSDRTPTNAHSINSSDTLVNENANASCTMEGYSKSSLWPKSPQHPDSDYHPPPRPSHVMYNKRTYDHRTPPAYDECSVAFQAHNSEQFCQSHLWPRDLCDSNGIAGFQLPSTTAFNMQSASQLVHYMDHSTQTSPMHGV